MSDNENKILTKEAEEILVGEPYDPISAAYRSQVLSKNSIDSIAIFLSLKDFAVGKQETNKLCKEIVKAISGPMLKWNCTKKYTKIAQDELAQYNVGHNWNPLEIVGYSKDGDGQDVITLLENNYKDTEKKQDLTEVLQAIFSIDKGRSSVYSFFGRVKEAQEEHNKEESAKLADDASYNANIVAVLDVESLWTELRNAAADMATVDVSKGVEALDQFDFVTNLDKWVAEHPQTTVGLDEEIKSVTLCLGCRN